MSEAGLFSADLISPEVSAALPEGYIIRALRPSDFSSGFLDCLRVLTTVGDISEDKFLEQYKWMSSNGGYYIIAVEDTSKGVVVGTGALIVERKLYVAASPSIDSHHPSLTCPFPSQHPQPRRRRPHRGHRRRQGPAGQEARPAHHPGPRLRRREGRLLQEHPRLQRGQRGLLRQVRLPSGRPANGTLLRGPQEQGLDASAATWSLCFFPNIR